MATQPVFQVGRFLEGTLTAGGATMHRTWVLFAGLLLVAACSAGESETSPLADVGDDASPCDERYAAGQPTKDIINDESACIDDEGGLTFVGTGGDDCVDGRELVWNDYGWGFSDEEWHEHEADSETLTPPEDQMELCSEGEPETGAGTSADEPLKPGAVAAIEDYDVTVVSFKGDATTDLLGANQFNEDPPANSVYALVRVKVTYKGGDEGSPAFDIAVGYVGADKRVYTDTDCEAVPPDSMADQPDVVSGGTVEGNFCLTIPRTVVGSGAVYIENRASFDDDGKRWWSES